MTIDKLAMDKMTFGQITVIKITLDRRAVYEMTIDKKMVNITMVVTLTEDKMTTDKIDKITS
jgi:hypothetical protein